jgi:hypothetical protein
VQVSSSEDCRVVHAFAHVHSNWSDPHQSARGSHQRGPRSASATLDGQTQSDKNPIAFAANNPSVCRSRNERGLTKTFGHRSCSLRLTGRIQRRHLMANPSYRGVVQRIRGRAEQAAPFTRRRLLDLVKRYDTRGGQPSASGRTERPLPASCTTPPASSFSGPGEA